MRQRRSIRLKHYDYRQDGAYFVTLCTHQRVSLFGVVQASEMNLNTLGCIVLEEWERSAALRPYVQLDAFVVMPNHIHGIIVINHSDVATTRRTQEIGRVVGTRRAVSLQNTTSSPDHRPEQFGQPVAGSLSTIVRAFKSACTRRINHVRQTPGSTVWQGRYYEHIIRHTKSMNRIRDYIQANPARWVEDMYYST